MNAPRAEFSFLMPAEQPDELGRLGSYRVLELIGEGGMGKVFLAEDLRLRRKVALKVMSQKIASSKYSRQRFIREARAQAAVHHDNVVTIFEVDQQNGMPFLAMELLQGRSLDRVLRKGYQFSPLQVIAIGRQVAKGLEAAHKQGIIHRDIKPANIWIESEKGRPKILDFGLAAMTGPVDTLARRGAVVGTPGYLAPEQACDEPVDDRSDIYSLGIVLFEMCCGKLPFRHSNVAMMLIAITTHSPPSLHELDPRVPVGLSDLVERMLSKEPKDRPPSASALIAELKHLADHLSAAPPAAVTSGNTTHVETEDHAQAELTPDEAFSLQLDFGDFEASPSAVGSGVSATDAAAASAPSDAMMPIEGERHDSSDLLLPLANRRPLLIASASVAVVLAMAAVMWLILPSGSSDLASNSTPPANGVAATSTTPSANPQAVSEPIPTVAGLRPLTVESFVLHRNPVKSGESLSFQFRLRNEANPGTDDPYTKFGSLGDVARFRVFLQPDDQSKPQPPQPAMFPAHLPGSKIPTRGQSVEIRSDFETQGFAPGNYRVQLRLFTRDLKQVSETTTSLEIQ